MGERKLAHVERVVEIRPIPGADNVELATVLGWHVMVRKNQFQVGDLGVYIEIDSKCPPIEAFKFLEKRKYAVKTQKFFKGTVLSQGLLMTFDDLGLFASDYKEGDDLTEKLGITYYEPEDQVRKAPTENKYKKMANRHQQLFKKKPIRWLMRRTWGKKLLYLFFGRKKDKKNGWPEWVKTTDEERIQNCPWMLEVKEPFICTEKVDGSSATYTIKRGKRGKYDFYVCSRRVVMDTPDRKNYYTDLYGINNIYWEIAIKYDIENVLKQMLKEYKDADWITIQGEIYGPKVQKRTYSLSKRDFAAFNLITSNTGRWNSINMKSELAKYEIPSVPILDGAFYLPDTVDEMLEIATGASIIDGQPREGLVLRSLDGKESFKAVSNEYLLKYHS